MSIQDISRVAKREEEEMATKKGMILDHEMSMIGREISIMTGTGVIDTRNMAATEATEAAIGVIGEETEEKDMIEEKEGTEITGAKDISEIATITASHNPKNSREMRIDRSSNRNRKNNTDFIAINILNVV